MLNQSLGRGLGSLIPSNKPSVVPSSMPAMPKMPSEPGITEVRKVAIKKIVSNPWQPRTSFDRDVLQELADSIKQYGIIQPLVITPGHDDTFQLIAGERRLRAAELAGLTEVPVIIRQAEDQEKLELALVENIQRQNLNLLDEAGSYRRLMDEFNLTQEQVAQKVGKSRPSVANFLRLLNLPEEVQQAIRQEKISFSHAKVILSLPDKQEQIKMLRRIISQNLPVSQIQKGQSQVKAHTRTIKDPALKSWEEKLTKYFGSKVTIKSSEQGGTIELHWQSDEDLKRIIDQLSTQR